MFHFLICTTRAQILVFFIYLSIAFSTLLLSSKYFFLKLLLCMQTEHFDILLVSCVVSCKNRIEDVVKKNCPLTRTL